MNIYAQNTIESILSIRTYINTCIILLPTILLSLLSSTLFRTFQSLCIMISYCAHLALAWLEGITFAVFIMCMAISFHVTLFTPTKNCFGLCPGFNFKAFDRYQLYEIWLHMGSLSIAPCLYNLRYSWSNSSNFMVNFNICGRIYSSVGHLVLAMKSISISQCLTQVYEAGSGLGDITISLPLNTQLITTNNNIFCSSGRILLACLPAPSVKSVICRVLPIPTFFLASRISLAHFFNNMSTHCHRIHSPSSKSSNSSQFMTVAITSGTAVSQFRGLSGNCFK